MTEKRSFNSEKNIWQKVEKNPASLDLISGKKIGHQAVSPTILRFFFYYLIPKINYVLVRSATREATSILGFLHQILTAAQHSGKQNFTDTLQIAKTFWPGLSEKFSFAFCVFINDSNFSRLLDFGSKKKYIYKENLSAAFESFLIISIFSFFATFSVFFPFNCLRKASKLLKRS